MAKNELTTQNKMELGNSELAKAVTIIRDASTHEKNCAWSIAIQYANIISNELFDEDFDNVSDFAVFMGVSKATISNYTHAVDYIARENSIYSANDLTVGKAYLLSTLKEKDLDFISWCNSNERDIVSMSDAGLKKTINEWKKECKAVEVDGDEVVGEEPVEETVDEPIEVVEFDIDGVMYRIPVDVLNQYRVDA